jgi:hypothetical protein
MQEAYSHGKQYEEEVLEPELRPEYIDKAKKIMEQKPVDVGTSENLRNLLGLWFLYTVKKSNLILKNALKKFSEKE